jgi:hypothetical protein
MSAEQIKQFLFDRQDDVEECWETGAFEKMLPPEQAARRNCARPMCNHSRYPAPNANFCLFHSRGHDSLAAAYERAKRR